MRIIYVVDKVKNDEWLKNDCPDYGYMNRPWAIPFSSEEEAMEYVELSSNGLLLESNDNRLEVEFPNGDIVAYEDGTWEVIFDNN
jgi:hypothetical protein